MIIGRFRSYLFVLSVFMLFVLSIQSAIASEVTREGGHDKVHPIRVVTLFQGATDSAVALGVTPVGVVDSWAQQPTYDYLRHALKGVAHVGLETQPNIEAILALKPDLIIGAKSRHEKIYNELSQIAPTVLTDNVYDFKATLELTAKALGKVDKGKQVWAAFQKRIKNFRSGIKKHAGKWPQTASILNFRSDYVRLYLQQSFPGRVLKEIGFNFPLPNKTGWGVKLKSKEALPRVNADVFFIILQSDEPVVRQNYRAWRSHPLWKLLNAPKHKQVFEVNRVDWLLSGGILGANLMLDQLYRIYHLPMSTD